MAQVRGIDAVFQMSAEAATSYGSTTVPTTLYHRLYPTAFNLSKSQNRINSNTITSVRPRIEGQLGLIDVTGSIDFELDSVSQAKLMKQIMGGLSSSTASPYTHTYTPGTLPSSCIELDYGSNLSGSGRVLQFIGCRVGSSTFTFPTEGFCTASVNFMGRNVLLASTLSGAGTHVTTFAPVPFSSFSGVVSEGGATVAVVQDLSITLDNGLDTSVYVIEPSTSNAGARQALPEGFCTVTGTVTMLLESTTYLAKALNNTETSLSMVLSRGTGAGTSGNEYVAFNVQTCKYKPQTARIERGDAGIKLNLEFDAYVSGTNQPLQIVLKNTVAGTSV